VRPVFLYWKSSPQGKLWISESGVRTLLNEKLPEGFQCKDVALWDEKGLLVPRIGFPEGSDAADRERLRSAEELVRRLLVPLGFEAVEVMWLAAEKPSESGSLEKILHDPRAWGGAAALLVGLAHMGVPGLVRALVAGGIAFGVAWFVLDLRGRMMVRNILRRLRG
jgi:hypothetical protein